jgi:hypothetical protein
VEYPGTTPGVRSLPVLQQTGKPKRSPMAVQRYLSLPLLQLGALTNGGVAAGKYNAQQ